MSSPIPNTAAISPDLERVVVRKLLWRLLPFLFLLYIVNYLDRINVGGMAEVFQAKAFGLEGFERIVAVKRILASIAEDKEFISMFIDEAKIAVQLNHANICQVFDLGKVDESYFIALEYVSGRDLRAIFDRCKQRLIDGSPTMQIAQTTPAITVSRSRLRSTTDDPLRVE